MKLEVFLAEEAESLLRYAYLLTGDVHEAEDLVQTVLTRVYRRWDAIWRLSYPRAYVRRMTLNAYLDSQRPRRSGELPYDPLDQTGAPRGQAVDDHAVHVVTRDQLWRAVRELPAQQRAAVVLRYYEDLTDSEIARALDVTESTVRAHVSRAIGTLRASGDEFTPAETRMAPRGEPR